MHASPTNTDKHFTDNFHRGNDHCRQMFLSAQVYEDIIARHSRTILCFCFSQTWERVLHVKL